MNLGDFVVVHSMRTKQTVYGIVGDSGHSSGAEGSLALLQGLGYPLVSAAQQCVAISDTIATKR